MRRHTLRPAPLALAIALAFGAAAVHAQGAGAPVQIAIKAQPLAQALNDWARQTRTEAGRENSSPHRAINPSVCSYTG